MALHGLSTVLLDAHGTLVELQPPAPRLRAWLRERHDLEVPLQAAQDAFAAEIAYYRAHLHEGRDAAGVADLRRRCAEVLCEALGLVAELTPEDRTALLLDAIVFRPFAEVPGVLRELRAAGRRLVVVSNWDASLPDTLGRLGLLELLDGVVTSAACGAAKPGPGIFSEALGLVDGAPEGAVHVGDSLAEDVAGARAAGIAPVLVARRGGTPAPWGGTGADVPTIRSLDELPALLRP